MDKTIEETKKNLEDAELEENTKQYVVFKIENEEYGVNIKNVDIVENVIPTTRVPKTPYFLRGVINLRGEIIPVIDLRKKFNFKEVEDTEDTRIVILKINEVKAGIIVDFVDEVLNLKDEQISSSGNITNELSEDYILAVANYDDKIITLLNEEKLIVLDDDS